MKSRVFKIWSATITFFVILVLVIACRKEFLTNNTHNGARNLQIYLTDHPCPFDSVFVEILFVEVRLDTGNCDDDDDDRPVGYHDNDDDQGDDDDDDDEHGCGSVWDTLAISPGVYNIMDLRNGVDTLLANGSLPAGNVKQIRLTLGTNNSVVIGGTTYPLNLFPGSSHYAYVKLDDDELEHLSSGKYAIWLDFDICRSIVQYNGSYFLKPYLKAFTISRFGAVEGEVGPRAAKAFVTVYNYTDTGTAIPDDDGEFKIRGLIPGVYTVLFDGNNGYNDTILYNVQVSAGRTTELRRISLSN
ncbi:MAG: DUF4382 domain-containing protein [Bacteroidetes bacterium]|nr:DUF4382 domain-containing protein [Bacteroidota bacterium]